MYQQCIHSTVVLDFEWIWYVSSIRYHIITPIYRKKHLYLYFCLHKFIYIFTIPTNQYHIFLFALSQFSNDILFLPSTILLPSPMDLFLTFVSNVAVLYVNKIEYYKCNLSHSCWRKYFIYNLWSRLQVLFLELRISCEHTAIWPQHGCITHLPWGILSVSLIPHVSGHCAIEIPGVCMAYKAI